MSEPSPRSKFLRYWPWVIAAVVGLLLAVPVYLFPCGCFGLSFWRSPTVRVRRLPSQCSVLQAPRPWVDQHGHIFDTQWPDEIVLVDDPTLVRYEVRQSVSGALYVSLAVQAPVDGAAARSGNTFELANKGLIEVSPSVTGKVLEYRVDGAWNSAMQIRTWPDSAVGRLAGGVIWQAKHSYLGPSLDSSFVPSSDWYTPWTIQRTGFVDISYGRRFTATIEYLFCGRESWMHALAAWHGEQYFTMPLSRDARHLVFCRMPSLG